MKNKYNFSLSMPLFILIGLLVMNHSLFIHAQEEELLHSELLEKSKNHYQEGERLYEEGDYLGSDEEFKKAQDLLDSLEEKEAVDKQREESLISENNTDKQTTGDTKKAGSEDYLKKALGFSSNGESDKAIENYQKAGLLMPKNADIHYNIAIEYLKTSRFKQAVEELEKVILLNPRDKDAYYNLGILYEEHIKDLKTARLYYSRYLKFAKGNKDIEEVKTWISLIDKKLKSGSLKGL